VAPVVLSATEPIPIRPSRAPRHKRLPCSSCVGFVIRRCGVTAWGLAGAEAGSAWKRLRRCCGPGSGCRRGVHRACLRRTHRRTRNRAHPAADSGSSLAEPSTMEVSLSHPRRDTTARQVLAVDGCVVHGTLWRRTERADAECLARHSRCLRPGCRTGVTCLHSRSLRRAHRRARRMTPRRSAWLLNRRRAALTKRRTGAPDRRGPKGSPKRPIGVVRDGIDAKAVRVRAARLQARLHLGSATRVSFRSRRASFSA
jgi:hypothetical protein